MPAEAEAVAGQETQQGQENQQGTENQEQTSQQTPNDSQQNGGGVQAETRLALMENLMRQQHRTISDLTTKLEREQQERERLAETSRPPENSSEFFNKPATAIREIIREETLKAVQPLYEFRNQLEAESKYTKLKGQFKNDPRFREIFPKIEAIVDQMMQGAEANEANMQMAVLSAAGSYALGMIPGQSAPAINSQPANPNVNQPNNQPPARVITPPHVRPTAPVNAGGDNRPKVRELSELENRLAREYGMTAEEYVAWLEEDPTKIASSRIGKKEEGK